MKHEIIEAGAMAIKNKWLKTNEVGINPGISWVEFAEYALSAMLPLIKADMVRELEKCRKKGPDILTSIVYNLAIIEAVAIINEYGEEK